ncbi:hypothetical protein [Paracoccus sp. 22332]|uniref:hypothetical protein n=1 Tax=Paracoccus sp. 22332 TaxID=3453913 RepID=UPI003F85D1F2
MAVDLIHPGASPHLFRGAHTVYFRGVRHRVYTAQGVPLLVDPPSELPQVAPALSGGALDLVDGDLVLVPPTVTRGRPDPQLVLVSLTRNGATVMDELAGDRIPDAAAGDYVALWSAGNGVGQPATRTASRTVAVISLPEVTLTLTPVVPALSEEAPIGTVVARISTDATTVVLSGADADLLEIDGADIVTAAGLQGRTSLEFSVVGTRQGYAPTGATVTLAVRVPDDPSTITPTQTGFAVANAGSFPTRNIRPTQSGLIVETV